MSVAKRRQTSSRGKRRRSHESLKKVNTSSCSKCKSAVMSHRACAVCGTYKGKEVLKLKSDKKDKK